MNIALGLSTAMILLLMGCAASNDGPPEFRSDIALPQTLPYPRGVSLFQDSGAWIYRQFRSGSRLYVYDNDAPGVSNCSGGCALKWPPLLARRNATPVGQWTLVMRERGRKQWAYQGRPVYRFIHGSRSKVMGEEADERWHLLVP